MNSEFTNSAANPNQRFILPNTGIDSTLIKVSVKENAGVTNGTKYSSQDSLFDIDSESKVFFLQEIDEDGGSKQETLSYVATNYFKG